MLWNFKNIGGSFFSPYIDLFNLQTKQFSLQENPSGWTCIRIWIQSGKGRYQQQNGTA